MEKRGFGLGDDSGIGDQKQSNPQESRWLSIQRCIKCLVHACQCRDANCRLPSCHKMKTVVRHAKSCKMKTNGGCQICRQLVALCCYHAEQCQEAKCPVLFCFNIKNKLRKQRLQQAQNLVRRIATKQNQGMSSAVPSPGNSNSSSLPSLGAQPHTSPHPPQPGIGMKPSSGSPVGALKTVQQVQAAAARQTVPHMDTTNYGKGNSVVNPAAANTGLMAPNQQMQVQMQKPMSQMMSGVPNRMLNIEIVASWENSGYPQNHQPHQNTQPLPNLQLSLRQPSQIMGGPNSAPNNIGNSEMGPPQVMPNPDPSIVDMQRSTPFLRISDINKDFKVILQFQFQQQPQQLMQPPVSPQQGILGYPQDPIPSPQQLMQQVSSPPPTAA